VETFLQDKQQNSRNADAFREFFVQYWRKGAVQNRFLTVAHRPRDAVFYFFNFFFLALGFFGIK